MSNRGNYCDGMLGNEEPQRGPSNNYNTVKSSDETYLYINEDEPVRIGMDNGSGFEINIKTLNSGYLVTVGCQQVAVEQTETLVKALGAYLENPSEFQTKWFNNPNRSKLS